MCALIGLRHVHHHDGGSRHTVGRKARAQHRFHLCRRRGARLTIRRERHRRGPTIPKPEHEVDTEAERLRIAGVEPLARHLSGKRPLAHPWHAAPEPWRRGSRDPHPRKQRANCRSGAARSAGRDADAKYRTRGYNTVRDTRHRCVRRGATRGLDSGKSDVKALTASASPALSRVCRRLSWKAASARCHASCRSPGTIVAPSRTVIVVPGPIIIVWRTVIDRRRPIVGGATAVR
jgi:hypothetical protein